MKKLKGFTLLELIIVMAIFSIIMYSAVQLLAPVSKFFVRSSNYENTTACIDNMRRCIEGNLKYADRVRAYNGFEPFTYVDGSDFKAITVSNDLNEKVKDFYLEFFKDRKFIDATGVINVLIFDNRILADDTALQGMSQLSQYTSAQLNQGKIVHLQFPFNNYNGDDENTIIGNMETPNLWSVNQKLYGNFDYRFSLDAVSQAIIDANTDVLTNLESGATTPTALSFTQTDASGSVVTDPSGNPISWTPAFFNPSDFNISISAREIRRTPNGLVREAPTTANVASFSMKNVLNASDGYRTSSLDYVTLLDTGTEDALHTYTAKPVPRYENIVNNTGTGTAGAFDGFYFIFTLPEEVNDHFDPNNPAPLNSQEIFQTTTT